MAEQPVPQTESANQVELENHQPVDLPAKKMPVNMAEKMDSGTPTFDMLMDVNLQLTVELGSTQMTVRQVLDLQKGAVIELNRIAGDAVDIYVNDRLLARGEVVVVDDKFGVRISELVSSAQALGEA